MNEINYWQSLEEFITPINIFPKGTIMRDSEWQSIFPALLIDYNNLFIKVKEYKRTEVISRKEQTI